MDRWIIDGMCSSNQTWLTAFLSETDFPKVIIDLNTKKRCLCALAIRENMGRLGNK